MGEKLKSFNEFIKTQKDLEDLFEGYGIETYKWGKKGNKSLKDLFQEIKDQTTELFLEDNKTITRKVRADSIYIYYSFLSAINEAIILKLDETVRLEKDASGKYTTKNMIRKKFASSVGTELEINEDPEAAAVECMKSKLDIKGNIVLQNKRSYTRELITNSSYPGLKTIYEITEFDTYISSIHFNPNGYCLEQNDRLCIWQWKIV